MVSIANLKHLEYKFQVESAEIEIKETNQIYGSKYLIVEVCRYRASINHADCGTWDSGFIQVDEVFVYHKVLAGNPYVIHSASIDRYGNSIGKVNSMEKAEELVRKSLNTYYKGLVQFTEGFSCIEPNIPEILGTRLMDNPSNFLELFTSRKGGIKY